MKKSLIALAVLAAAGTASAQSSVTLFGVVDAVVQRVNNSGGASVTRLTQGAYNSSRLGFRGVEDLGGGSSASFWLEAGLNNDDGTGQASNLQNQNIAGQATSGGGLTFNRRSTVSLAGGWGEVRLGRDYTPQFWNLTSFDPFGTVGVGTTMTTLGTQRAAVGGATAVPTAVRASNSLAYHLPANLGGIYGQANYWLGENASTAANKNDGTGYGIRLGWANGPFNVAVSLSKTKYLVGSADMNNIAGSWDAGFAKIMAQYVWDKTPFYGVGTGRLKGRGWLVGGLIPLGAGEVRLSASQYVVDNNTGADPRGRKYAIGYVHNLSKRTALYVTAARVNNSGGATWSIFPGTTAGNPGANAHSSGYDLGIRHSF